MIIVDTNVLSEPLKRSRDPQVVQWLDAQVVETLFLTTITVAEVRFGVAALPSGKRKSLLGGRFENEVLPRFANRILTFDEPATREYAALRTKARASGAAIGQSDAMIAAIARVHRFGVATRHVAPFEAAEIRPLINPFATEAS